MKIYIAGKVTGLPIHETTMKFGAVQKKINDRKGFTAVNPLEVVNDWEADWETAMRKCLKALMDCDGIYLLSDWKESKGARLEKEIAISLKMFVFSESKNDFQI